MQTFLTHSQHSDTAKSLDSRRLNKQRVECKQIYQACIGWRETETSLVRAVGWVNHPAVKMWRGYEQELAEYAVAICNECDSRGIADYAELRQWFLDRCANAYNLVPSWWTDPTNQSAIIHSHRANLVHKDSAFYVPQFGQLDWVPYVWPVGKNLSLTTN